MKKRLFAVLATIILLTTAAAFTPSFGTETEAATISEIDAEIAECNSILSALIAERASVNKQIAELDKNASNASTQIELCIQQRDLIQAEIDLMDETIAQYDLKSALVMADVLILSNELDVAKDMYNEVLLYTYNNGGVSNFEMLFTSDNFSDFLTRMDNAKYIIEYSNSLLNDLVNAQNDLNIICQDYDSAKVSLQEYIDRQNEAKDALAEKQAELDAMASELGINREELTSKYSNLSAEITSLNSRIAALKKKRQDIINSMSDFLFPLPDGSGWRLTSNFGKRVDPVTGKVGANHQGIDLAVAYGTKILASKAGTVTTAGYQASGYGNYVIVYHGNGISTLYAHCSQLLVSKGDVVSQGQVIAKVGSTGKSTGNHLHFGVILNGTYVDPKKYLSAAYFS